MRTFIAVVLLAFRAGIIAIFLVAAILGAQGVVEIIVAVHATTLAQGGAERRSDGFILNVIAGRPRQFGLFSRGDDCDMSIGWARRPYELVRQVNRESDARAQLNIQPGKVTHEQCDRA